MSFRQTVARFFSDHAETNDTHMDPSLKTHYYKTTGNKGLQMLESLFQDSPKYHINAKSTDRGEISATIVKGRKAFIVATVVTVRPFQTAIDFSVTTESILPVDFGYSHKVIQTLYTYTDKKLPPVDNKRQQR